jgi:hypothetical protein
MIQNFKMQKNVDFQKKENIKTALFVENFSEKQSE